MVTVLTELRYVRISLNVSGIIKSNFLIARIRIIRDGYVGECAGSFLPRIILLF